MNKQWSFVLLVLLCCSTLSYAQFDGGNEGKNTFKPYKAPDFELVDMNGQFHKLSAYQGKVVYVEFWATWCGACMKRMKDVNKLKKQFEGNQNVVFIQVSTDKDKTRWENFMKERNPTGIQLFSDNGKMSNVRVNYNVRYLPTIFLLDSKGDVALDPSIIDTYDIDHEIEDLLKEMK
ncbi:MAG: hypothetical protein RIQ70_837 [Bacteroidota bacterium]|jgi:peroxiredoxin